MIGIDVLNRKKMRYERKFLVYELDKHEVEYYIKRNPAMFSEIFYERAVNNMYMDSVDMDSYYDNLAGIGQRLKVRIRWYGNFRGFIRKPVLELKVKSGELGSKLSFPLKPFRLDNLITMGDLMKNVFCRSSLPPWVIECLKSLEFRLMNRYIRKYFVSVDGKYRITLDHDMEYYRIGSANNSFLERVMHDDYVILELKYGKDADSEASRVTNDFPFRLTKSSKYILGVESLD